MSGLLKKLRQRISPSHADTIADAVEKNVTEERVDSAAERLPGGSTIADKTPEDLNTRAADATRGTLGWKKPES